MVSSASVPGSGTGVVAVDAVTDWPFSTALGTTDANSAALPTVKLDLAADYEDVSNDPNRQDRGIVSLTFTRMIGKMQAAAGIVYANHSEFLSDVNARLSAHIGLRIGMFNETGSNP